MYRMIIFALLLVSPSVYADEEEGICHIHKSLPIHFRSFKVKDILELSVGPGPCATAIMTLNIRSDEGDVFYTYASQFALHVVPDPNDPNFDKFIEPFLKNLETGAQKNARDMPKYYKQDEANGLIKLHVKRNSYKAMRLRHVPMLYHLTSHDRWQYVMFNKKKSGARVVVSGELGGMY